MDRELERSWVAKSTYVTFIKSGSQSIVLASAFAELVWESNSPALRRQRLEDV